MESWVRNFSRRMISLNAFRPQIARAKAPSTLAKLQGAIDEQVNLATDDLTSHGGRFRSEQTQSRKFKLERMNELLKSDLHRRGIVLKSAAADSVSKPALLPQLGVDSSAPQLTQKQEALQRSLSTNLGDKTLLVWVENHDSSNKEETIKALELIRDTLALAISRKTTRAPARCVLAEITNVETRFQAAIQAVSQYFDGVQVINEAGKDYSKNEQFSRTKFLELYQNPNKLKTLKETYDRFMGLCDNADKLVTGLDSLTSDCLEAKQALQIFNRDTQALNKSDDDSVRSRVSAQALCMFWMVKGVFKLRMSGDALTKLLLEILDSNNMSHQIMNDLMQKFKPLAKHKIGRKGQDPASFINETRRYANEKAKQNGVAQLKQACELLMLHLAEIERMFLTLTKVGLTVKELAALDDQIAEGVYADLAKFAEERWIQLEEAFNDSFSLKPKLHPGTASLYSRLQSVIESFKRQGLAPELIATVETFSKQVLDAVAVPKS